MLPPVQQRLAWRIEVADGLPARRGQPVGKMPTADHVRGTAVETPVPTAIPTQTAQALDPNDQPPTPTTPPRPTPTPIPQSISLPAPAWEKQDMNNCGPASLAMYLRYYGWEGDQFSISSLIKPERDRPQR